MAARDARQRAIVYTTQQRKQNDNKRDDHESCVPMWLELPLLRPLSSSSSSDTKAKPVKSPGQHETTPIFTPKVSRLVSSPAKSAASSGRPFFSSSLLYKRRRSQAGVVLEQLDRKARLTARIWRDLESFGVWHVQERRRLYSDLDSETRFDDGIDNNRSSRRNRDEVTEVVDTTESVEQAVDAIFSQWHYNSSDKGSEGYPEKTAAAEEEAQVFLTAVPSTSASEGVKDENYGNVPEDDSSEEQEGDGSYQPTRRQISLPGMKRRARLKDLHQFVETALQKRLLRSWDTIEIAFTGSGELTSAQIVKFLQHSDVKLGAHDAAKVQSILNMHIHTQRMAAQMSSSSQDANDKDVRSESHSPSQSTQPATLTYEDFRQMFHPKNPQDAARWKREFDREKVKRRQEQDIYQKELAALEEKVKKRLAESAKHMVEVLDRFSVDPLGLPWENDEQRLRMRSEFFEIIFSKPQRRNMTQTNSVAIVTLGDTRQTSIPEKLSVKLVRSALLQKYSRNGHFEHIDVSTASYLFHDFVVDCVKNSVFRYWKKCEADLWPERQLIFQFRRKKQIFYEWRRFTKYAETLRRFIMRKFVAWAYYTRKMHEHYSFIRVCFWPFYVWKRHLQQQIIARGKSVFLHNVVMTYIQLRHLNAWTAYFRKRKRYRQQVFKARAKAARKVLQCCWAAWHGHTSARVRIHRLWKGRGHILQRLHKMYMVKVTLYVWRYYTILKQDLKLRRYNCPHALLVAMQNRPERNTPSSCPKHTASSPTLVRRPMNSSGRWNESGYLVPENSSLHSSAQMAKTTGLLKRVSSIKKTIHKLDGNGNEEEDENDNHDVAVVEESSNENIASLSRIMQTEIGSRIKRKSRLYDLCLQLYLRYREKDRRDTAGNVTVFRRIGKQLLSRLRQRVEHNNKNRFASDVGAFRLQNERFRQWKIAIEHKTDKPVADDHIEIHRSQSILEEKRDIGELNWVHDTVWRRTGIEQCPLLAQQLRCDLIAIDQGNSDRMEVIHDREVALTKRKSTEEGFLRKETSLTLKMKATQMQQAQQIFRTRGHRLHDILDRVFDNLLEQQTRSILKSCFRSLRVMVMMKYTQTICHRVQIRNWLRLCKRFFYWESRMTSLHAMKTKYHAFQSLLKHAVWQWKLQSPGLPLRLKRRQELIWKQEQALIDCGLLNGSATSTQLALTKESPSNCFRCVFLRWVQYTQTSYASRQMVALARRKHELWLTYVIFCALKHHVKVRYSFETRLQHRPFLWRQCEADLDEYHCKILAYVARLPTTKLKQKIKAKLKRLQHSVRSTPTLKQLFQQHEEHVRERLYLENRLMFVTYNDRKIHHYAERTSPLFGSYVGRQFAYEKAPPYGSISDIAVFCSKQVDGISLVVKTNASVIVEGSLHGNPFGNREVFSLVRGEVLVSIEGFASQTIYGLRFGTSTGRQSKWYGHCEKGTKFELRSEYSSKREEIVGITGYADATSLHAIGAVFRYTTHKNLFEGMWLQNESATQSIGSTRALVTDEVRICDRQFAYFLQVRTCDVLSAMKRAQAMALRVHRLSYLPSMVFTRPRILMGIMRWLFNGLVHGLVCSTASEAEGKMLLQNGLNRRAAGEKMFEEGVKLIQYVDSFRDEDQQLNIATLGVKKAKELHEFMEQGELKIVEGKQWIQEGQTVIHAGRAMLPHIPMTKRMMRAIRRMYKVVQTKDYIDQMDPDLRAILLMGDNSGISADDRALSDTRSLNGAFAT